MSLTFHERVSLKPYNTFGIAVSARRFTTLSDLDDLPALLDCAPYREGPVLFLGGGSNLLFTRDYPGLVVKLELSGVRVLAEDETGVLVEAAAGEAWHPFVRSTLAEGWSGLENLSLIPGTVGAAPIQNIGAYGAEVKDTIEAVVCADLDNGGAEVVLSNADCRFAYRDSVFKREAAGRLLVTAVRFRLSKTPQVKTGYGDIAGELARMGIAEPTPLDVSEAVIRIRQAKLPDPAVLGNAGSFFKNPIVDAGHAERLIARFPAMPHYPAGEGRVKLAAGWLIDAAGLKGYRDGDAAVHDRQALVLVNHGGASGSQIRALAQKVQDTVFERYGVRIEPEPIVL
ncbi:UDP-N-acetylmuramate dehydrogenase [Crenobacter cavernae]|uniref:UDP-N-acetylenolpyruvoylglucosamine reductase n=1 Tax=Crenobacter cavernae TaxID=2290923 RepID=A0ABY0F9W1_9NEIS|nr:UDP-N-acetylmuramate dehydrogenase [Crenobacter cavernae]RXZ42454.1 UDP-N-acetylmuramate dehydrogenase [Crenobacter cavernae]